MPLQPEPSEQEKLQESNSLPNQKPWLKKPQGSDK
jgi:hypothetical protein